MQILIRMEKLINPQTITVVTERYGQYLVEITFKKQSVIYLLC